MDPQESSRLYLDDLDRRAAAVHLHRAAKETNLAVNPLVDIVRRDAHDAWQRFDHRMEDSRWLGGGPDRPVSDFTRWDDLKEFATDRIRDPFLNDSSTHDLQAGMHLHQDFAKRYAKYAMHDSTPQTAFEDGTQAIRQTGMYARDAFEVGRREARDALIPMRERLLLKSGSGLGSAGAGSGAYGVTSYAASMGGRESSDSSGRPINIAEGIGAAAVAGAAMAAGVALLRHEVKHGRHASRQGY
ncbi:hypothetical protein JCM10908_000202 [Rhodotorula pacifica]|uniref:uncharacterized protein n=1 Tax=Rhodotorula pacifica TaxID=1495444 RepID=UPI00317B10CE